MQNVTAPHRDRPAAPVPRRVLVVDDDPAHRKLMQRVLADRGYDCDVAAGSDRARLFLDCGQPEKVAAHVARAKAAGTRMNEIIHKIKHLHSDRVVRYSRHASIIDLNTEDPETAE